MKKLLLSLILALTAFAPLSTFGVATAKAASVNTAIRGTTASTVFWYANDGKRYVFPNAATYYTWFPSFDNVITISDNELFSIAIGGNVTYRPAAKLVKINTDPKVYAIARGGVLRHVTSEFLAERLYGSDWRSDVHDIPDVYFTNYTVGAPIFNESDLNTSNEYHGVSTPSDSLRGMTGTGSTGDLVLNASRTSINPGEAVTLSVSNTFNYSSGYRVEIYDTRTNGLIRTCNLPASICEVTVFPQRNASENSVQYYAALRDVNSATIKSGYSPVIYFGGSQTGSLTVNVDRTTVANGGTVVVSTSGNMPTGMYSLVLINEQTGATVATCYSMSCSQSVTVTGTNGQMVRFRAEARNSNGSVISTAYSSYVTVSGTQTGTLVLSANRTTITSGETITLTASGANSFNTARIVFINEQNGNIIANCYSVSSCSQNVMVTGYNGETIRFRAEARDWNGSIVATAYVSVYVTNTGYFTTPVITSPVNNQVLTNFPRTLSITWTGTARRHQVEISCPSCWPIVGQNANPGYLTTNNNQNWVNTELTGDDNVSIRVRAINEDGSYGTWSNSVSIKFTTGGQSGTGENRINGLVLNADRTSINAGELVRLTANAFHAGTWSYVGNRIEIWSVGSNQLLRTCYDVSTCTLDVYPQAQSSTNLTAQYQARIYDRNGNLAMSQYSAVIYLSSFNGSQNGTISGSGFVSFAPTSNLRPNQMVYITGTFSNSNLAMADAKVELYVENQSTPIATCTGSYTCSVSYPTGTSPMTTRVYARLSNRFNASQWLETPRVSMTTNW